MKDCHRLIKDTAAEKGRLTLQSYLHNFQPEGYEVEPGETGGAGGCISI